MCVYPLASPSTCCSKGNSTGGNLVIQVGDEMQRLLSRVPKSIWSHCSLKNRGCGQDSEDLGLLLLQLSASFMTLGKLINFF